MFCVGLAALFRLLIPAVILRPSHGKQVRDAREPALLDLFMLIARDVVTACRRCSFVRCEVRAVAEPTRARINNVAVAQTAINRMCIGKSLSIWGYGFKPEGG